MKQEGGPAMENKNATQVTRIFQRIRFFMSFSMERLAKAWGLVTKQVGRPWLPNCYVTASEAIVGRPFSARNDCRSGFTPR